MLEIVTRTRVDRNKTERIHRADQTNSTDQNDHQMSLSTRPTSQTNQMKQRDEHHNHLPLQRPPAASAKSYLLTRLLTLATLLEILHLEVLHSQAAYLSSSRSFPFKTSFVSSSDNIQLRRNGALASLQLANLEQANQQYPMLAAESLLMDAGSTGFDAPADASPIGSSEFEPQYGASAEASQQNSNQRDSTPTQLTGADSSLASPSGSGGGGSSLSSSSGSASAEIASSVQQSDDLLAIPSNNSNQTVANETNPTPSTTNPTTTTTTTKTTTTTTTTPNPSTTTTAATTTTSTTTAPLTTSLNLNSSSSEQVSSSAPTLAPVAASTPQLNFANSQPNSTTIEVINNPEDKPTTTTPTTTSTTQTAASSEPATQTTTPTPTSTSTTATITTTTTPMVANRRDRDEAKSSSERESRTAEREPAGFGGRIATTTPPTNKNSTGAEATGGRGRFNCQNGPDSGEKCARSGGFVVAKVPVFDKWQQMRNVSTQNGPKQVVNEFVFVPEDSMGSLELDQTGFVNVTNANHQQNSSDSQSLPAEHRTIDDSNSAAANFANSSLMLVNDNGEIELDYVNLDSSDNDQATALQSDRSVPGLIFNTASERLKPTTTMATTSTSKAPATETTTEKRLVVAQTQPTTSTTTTTTTAKPPPTTTSALVRDIARATNTLVASTKAPERSTPTPQKGSITVSELQSERLNLRRRPSNSISSSTRPPVAPTRPTTISTFNQQASFLNVRKNNKFLVEPPEARQTTTSSTARPRPKLIKLDNLRTASARRLAASSLSQQQQQQQQPSNQRHKQVFNEPTGDWHRRRNKETFSPLNNGADEEEASILTRYSMTSQLSRLSSLDKLQPNSIPLRVTNSERQTVARWPVNGRLSAGASNAPATTTASSIQSSVATSTSTSVEWSRPTTTSRPPTTSAQQQLEAVVTELARAQNQKAASESSRWLEPLESSTTTGSSGDFISKLMDEEDKEEEDRELKSTREIVLTLIASSSPTGQPLDRRQSSLVSTTVANVDSKPVSSTIEPSGASSSTASPQTTLTTTPTTTTTVPSRSSSNSSESGAQSRSEVTTTTTRDRSDELLLDQVIKKQLKRDHVSDNKRPRSLPKNQLAANSYRQTSSTTTTRLVVKNQPRVEAKPKATTGDNAHDFDSGKWQPDTNLDYSPIQDYETNRQQRVREQLAPGAASATSANANGHNQQDSLPGRPGVDYPVHWQVPKTSFDCRNYEQIGFYADVESDCQAYHSCHRGRGGRHTFLCPNGTLFSQELLTCDWWYNVECSQSKFYMPNGENNSANSDDRESELTTTTTVDVDEQTGGGNSRPPATQTTAVVL